MILIGSVTRYYSGEAKRKLLQLLKANNEIRQSLRSGTQNPPVDKRVTEKESMANRVTLPVRDPGPDVGKYSSVSKEKGGFGKYSSALKEKGDIDSFVPEYNYDQVSEVPPIFKAAVSFQEYVFEGRGRTKHLAKHEASREACIFLNLQVP